MHPDFLLQMRELSLRGNNLFKVTQPKGGMQGWGLCLWAPHLLSGLFTTVHVN